MMKWTLLLILFTALVAKPTSAQSDNNLWFWAWRSNDLKVERAEDQRGDLLAFTPDGTFNILLKDVFPIVLRRVDKYQAFVLGKIDNTYHLYYLTSTQAIDVMELFDQGYMDEWRNYALYDGYAYFAPEIISAGENRFLIADRKRGQYLTFDATKYIVTSLKHIHAWCNDECVRVSSDGRYIRYRVSPIDPMNGLVFSDPGENALPYQIFEYDTETQTERLIYEQKSIDYIKGQAVPPHADCTPDQYGDRWYCELFIDDAHSPGWIADEKYIVSVDGTIQAVPPQWKIQLLRGRWYFLDFDRYPELPGICMDCGITVHVDNLDGRSFQFLPPEPGALPWKGGYMSFGSNIQLLSEQYIGLGVQISSPYAVSRGGTVTKLGVRHCCTDPISQDFYDEASGWMISVNAFDLDNPRTEIWNTRILERIASLPYSVQPGVRSTFRDYSFVLFEEVSDGTPAVAYSYFDVVLYEFDFAEPRGYFDAFPGGVLLVDHGDDYWVDHTYAAKNDGIYRWTASEGESLLIDSAVPIPGGW